MKRFFYFLVFAVGLAVVAWVGAGYVGSNVLALVVTAVIALAYLFGGTELLRYDRATKSLDRGLVDPELTAINNAPSVSAPDSDASSSDPASQPHPESDSFLNLDAWLSKLDASLRDAVRLRIHGERVGLPAPALTPYLVGLLVLLGMLGTFLGMVATLRGTGLALEHATDLQAIRASLAAPVQGLGFAFGTSVAGVATSAMLGLLSALCRRDRMLAARSLDAAIASTLQRFSRAHQRDQAAQWLHEQVQALPIVAQHLKTVVTSLEARALQIDGQLSERSRAINEQLTERQQRVSADLLDRQARTDDELLQRQQRAAEALLERQQRVDTELAERQLQIQSELLKQRQNVEQTLLAQKEAIEKALLEQREHLEQTILEHRKSVELTLSDRHEAAEINMLAQRQKTESELLHAREEIEAKLLEQQRFILEELAQQRQASEKRLTEQREAMEQQLLERQQLIEQELLSRRETVDKELLERRERVDRELLERRVQVDDELLEHRQSVDKHLLERARSVDEQLEARSVAINQQIQEQSRAVNEQIQAYSLVVHEQIQERSLRLHEQIQQRSEQLDALLEQKITALHELLHTRALAIDERLESNITRVATLIEENLTQQYQRLLAAQEAFHTQLAQVYTQLSESVQAALSQTMEKAGAAVGEAMQPAVEATLAQLSRDTQILHQVIEQAVQQQLEAAAHRFEQSAALLIDGVAGNLQETSQQLTQDWRATLTQQQAVNQQLTEDNQRVQRAIVDSLQQQSAQLIERMRTTASDSLQRDNAMLQERTQLMETLSTLLDALNHATHEQRTAIDALLSNSSNLLDRIGSQVTDKVAAETGKLGYMASQVTESAIQIADLGDTFDKAVQTFRESSTGLVSHLERLEQALDSSLTRSDEQLAYYVAQAREVVDLSMLSQKQILEELQLLGSDAVDGGRA